MAFQNRPNFSSWFDSLLKESRRESAPPIDVRDRVWQTLCAQEAGVPVWPALPELSWKEVLLELFSLPATKGIAFAWLLAILLSFGLGGLTPEPESIDPLTHFLLSD